MIAYSREIDLGQDKTRMKDVRDAQRQRSTVETILRRFTSEDLTERWELQLLADEVGMGKTFVALGVAYSVLAAMGEGEGVPDDLRGCAPKVLVIAPQNSALVSKWQREVGEFIKRCWKESGQSFGAEHRWFKTREPIRRLDTLAAALHDPKGPAVIVTDMGALTGKLQHYDVKRRYLLGHLFRVWSNALPIDARGRLLKGAPENWPKNPSEVGSLSEDERRCIPIGEEAFRSALDEIAGRASDDSARGLFEYLLKTCRELAEPYKRDRAEQFQAVERGLAALYRHVCFASIQKAIPLVIVDEAHNWKNGPRARSNGYGAFADFVAPHTRRALLLTATPFQLRPDEMLELLKVGDVIAPGATSREVRERRERMGKHRESVLRPVLSEAATRSRSFAKCWATLDSRTVKALETAWTSEPFAQLRLRLRDLARAPGALASVDTERQVEAAMAEVDPDLRAILREGLRLYAHNEDLSQELGQFVIRHRRRTDHRLVRVGAEYVGSADAARQRPDRSVLHAAPGLDVRGGGELPHYLLMRAVSLMKGGKGKTSLGTALTGCYSTLFESAEGRKLSESTANGGRATPYFDLLRKTAGVDADPSHPKVKAVVDAVLAAWQRGEKSLIFCFRSHTAKRLQQILDGRIAEDLRQRQRAVLGGGDALTSLRNRFTRRDGSLVTLGLDRVLWSICWAARSEDLVLPELSDDSLRLRDEELTDLASLALRYGVDLRAELVDRVFIHRATEHILARRMRRAGGGGPMFGALLKTLEQPAWVARAYGIDADAAEGAAESVDGAAIDERGVHEVYREKTQPSDAEVGELADALRTRRARAKQQGQESVFDAYAEGASFWLGSQPGEVLARNPGGAIARTLAQLHSNLLLLTRDGRGFDWRERRMVLQALRRALMRESVLLRVLPDRAALDEGAWSDLLVDAFFRPLDRQQESMADRLAVFVEDLRAASGRVYAEGSERNNLYEATRMRDSGFVVLVDGGTREDRRRRVFAGFNSPLLPEVMVCTSVGQEGIDLHRHCRHVVHYDLAWNPAVLEQRTGRVDRIGSKTFRERAADPDGAAPAMLEVGVPFLAATYDERMYEELRIRAQTFEVLTGGDVTSDEPEGVDVDDERAEGEETGLAFPTLPEAMIRDLRVRLHVWEG